MTVVLRGNLSVIQLAVGLHFILDKRVGERERQSERVKKQEEERERLTSSYQLKKNVSLFLLIHFCVCSDTYFDSGCLSSSIH